jgi:hypothetical protein
MGKEYGHVYHHAGGGCQAGEMKCGICNKEINSETQDWLQTQKNSKGDWVYKSKHRNCISDQSGWLKIEKQRSKHEGEVDSLADYLRRYMDKNGNGSNVLYDALEKIGIETC